MILNIIVWVVIFSFAVYLLRRNILSKKKTIVLLLVSFVITGILLGAMPNSVSPINQFFVLIGPTSSQPLIFILPMLILLLVLLTSTVIFGRMYCGYSCPLGAMQELNSKMFFKANVKEQKKVKWLIKAPTRVTKPIRWVYIIFFAIIAFVWGTAVSGVMNLFSAFQILQKTSELLIIPAIFFILIFILSFFIYRPWCRFFCPFGALSSSFNKYYQYKLVRTDNCTNCGLCEQICPTEEAYRESTKAECYYCNRCIEVCPHDAIIWTKAV